MSKMIAPDFHFWAKHNRGSPLRASPQKGALHSRQPTAIQTKDSSGIVGENLPVGLRESPRGIINGHNKVCVSTK